MTKNKMTREEAISVLNHVVEYYDMNYDTGEEESTTEETNNAWDALEVLINERIRHNDLTHYFIRDHRELPAGYLRSCEKFFKELSIKRQASSVKPQASSNKRLTFK